MNKPRVAAGDDLFRAMDDAISNFVRRNEPRLVNMYQQRAGRSVDAAEMDFLPEEFGDFVYDSIFAGPEGAEAIKRFVGFHLNEVKMDDLMDEFVAQKRPVIGLATPPVVASALRKIAARLDNSKSPSRAAVETAIRQVLAAIEKKAVGFDSEAMARKVIALSKELEAALAEGRELGSHKLMDIMGDIHDVIDYNVKFVRKLKD